MKQSVTNIPFAGSVASACGRFAGGAKRHSTAMAALPDSRFLEIAPLHYLLPPKRDCLIDLFAGTGLVANSLRRYFVDTVLVDPYVAPLGDFDFRCHRNSALDPDEVSSLPEADLAICLAGFHHVLGDAGTQSVDTVRQYRLEVLRLWQSKLTPNGQLIVADVPACGARIGWCDGRIDGLIREIGPFDNLQPALALDGGFGPALRTPSLGEYLTVAAEQSNKAHLGEPEPAAFFDQVVAGLSPQGHLAEFCSPEELVELFVEAGFRNVRAFVAPTPWLFHTKPEALWFVHELLNIGQQCKKTEELSADSIAEFEAGVAEYLGIGKLSNDIWVLPWKLLYVSGDKP